MDFDWRPPEVVEEFRRLQAEDWSYSEIARRLCGQFGGRLTRSAVIGKAQRLGLPARRVIVAGKPKRPRRPPIPTIIRPPPEPMPDPILDTDIPLAQRRSLMELTNETCRWPCGDPDKPEFFFCGALTADLDDRRPYCPDHTRRASGGTERVARPFIPARRDAA